MPDYERNLQDLKADILARTDIVDVISGYTRLTKAGKNWKGLCPFHSDKNPSFSVTPELNHYRCWSCGEKGDVITFVMKKENLEFMDALERLAQRAGVPFVKPGYNPEQASLREQMLELNILATKFFQDRLTKSQDAKDYLARRGLLVSTQEQWDIGYAPPGYENLTYFLQRRRANMELAAKLGLIKKKEENGSYYDVYRDRVMFPIHNKNGNVVGFGGRILQPNDKVGKYINSSASPIFNKSEVLYGIAFALKKIGGDTPPVFVEGYLDVITTHQAGFSQCVATLGTAMTEENARSLVRLNPRVIVCYDSDGAGIKAALAGAAVWESLGVAGAEVRVARLPAGDDPDSILQRGETAKFQAALDNPIPRLDFMIELALKRHDLKSEAGRDAALAEVIPILASVPTQTQRERYAQNLAYLHPSHGYNVGRAIEQIVADAETYARQSRTQSGGRNAGYPLTQNQNGQPLAGELPPPTFRPPDANSWGTGQWPNTQNVVRKGESRPNPDGTPAAPDANGAENAPPPDPSAGYAPPPNPRNGNGPNGYNGNGNGYGNRGYGQNGYGGGQGNYRSGGENRDGNYKDYGGRGGYGNGNGYGKNGKRWRDGPVGDPTPPPLNAPAMTGVQKAEWQLLRACFSPEWRIWVLTRLQPELLVSPECRGLYAWLQRTPATPEGGIDARALMARIEEAETSSAERAGSAPESIAVSPGTANLAPESGANAFSGETSAKISAFLYELLQESVSLVSNEALNEAAVSDCVRRLQKYQTQQTLRAEAERLLHMEALPPEQRKQAIEQYHQKVRETRGSPPAEPA